MYKYENFSQANEESISNVMSVRSYNIVIGLVLLWGFAINVIMCTFFQDTFLKWNPVAVIVVYFVSALAGIGINKVSKNPFISFIGYSLIVLPVGVVLSIGLKDYDSVSILNAMVITTLVTVVMIVIACVIPNVFLSMGKLLFVSLIIVIIGELILLLFGIITPTLLDFVIAMIFCGYIGYDWSVAQSKLRTLDNAVDSVVDLYLDIINLFVRILAILGKKD